MKKLRDDKIVGYVLLAVGLVMILFAVRSMYGVYTGADPPPSVIRVSDVKFPVPSEEGQPREEVLLISGDQASKVINMGLWSVLMLFVASAGAKIGGLGVKMAREIKVEVKRED
ncbi:MAG: hypothetical protein QMC89_04325 [Candidatus Hodarchaeaceae archaeon]|nr:hypothetical protein [Candidatus Hodarchaeaceae archaeon]